MERDTSAGLLPESVPYFRRVRTDSLQAECPCTGARTSEKKDFSLIHRIIIIYMIKKYWSYFVILNAGQFVNDGEGCF